MKKNKTTLTSNTLYGHEQGHHFFCFLVINDERVLTADKMIELDRPPTTCSNATQEIIVR